MKKCDQDEYHKQFADGTEVSLKVEKWGQNWRIYSFAPYPSVTGIYFSKREARAGLQTMVAEIERIKEPA